MSDNTVLNGASVPNGDTVRDLARQGGNVKTQVVQLDIGGSSSNSEVLITAGQQTMAASVPVVLASNQPAIAIAELPASNVWGQALAVTAGATATLSTVLIGVASFQVRGFVAHGTGDGYFAVQVDGVTVLSGRARSSMPTLMVMLPNGIAVAAGKTVTFKVTNESGSTADYESTLLGA